MAKANLLTRRGALQTITVACCCMGAAPARSEKQVDQITDSRATAAQDMFRFAPNLLRVVPGESIVFLNSRGQHTVHSVPQLWPQSAPAVAISNKPEVSVTFDEEGFYGFRCRRHGIYGMVMLVVCGHGGDLQHALEQVDEMKARAREKLAFKTLLANYQQTLG